MSFHMAGAMLPSEKARRIGKALAQLATVVVVYPILVLVRVGLHLTERKPK